MDMSAGSSGKADTFQGDAMDSVQHDLLELAMGSLPTGLFICDREGVIRFINEAYANYLGVRPDEAIGRHITDFIPDSGIPAVIASGEPELGAWRHLHGSRRKLLVNRIPLRDENGRVAGALSMTLFDTPEQMQALLRRVEILDKKVNAYAGRIRSALRASHTIDSMIGESQGMTAFKSYLLRYARTDAPILILGATGTGKELAASAIHRASARADGPFVSLNCAAIPKELFESEVFGYAPGAFSGAHRDGKIGQIELVDRGTLFLDEIGDLPPHAQVKLLRVLEEKRIVRLGASRPREVDFRLVAATNRDLTAMIAAGTFREDLYYRISPMTLHLPPLAERAGDIPLLVRDILNRMGAEDIRCTDAALAELARYAWPGNVRELRNVLVRARTLCRDNSIGVADLPPEVLRQNAAAPPASGRLEAVVKTSEAQAILSALDAHRWNVVRTASALGVSRASLYEKMRKLGIHRPADNH